MAKTDKAETATPETAQVDAETPAQDETPGWAHDEHHSGHVGYMLADDDLTKDLPACFWEAVGMHAYSKHEVQMARLISVLYENGLLGNGPFSLHPSEGGRKQFKAVADLLRTTENGLSLIIQIAEDKWSDMERKMIRSKSAVAEAEAVLEEEAEAKAQAATEAKKEDTDTDEK